MKKFYILFLSTLISFAALADRQTLLVNPKGIIAKHHEGIDPDTHTQEVLSDLETMMSESQQ